VGGHLNTRDLLDALTDDPMNVREFVPERSFEAFECYRSLAQIFAAKD
jgi:hypothetical protein